MAMTWRAALVFAAILVAAVPFALLTALVETAFSPLEHLDRDVAEDLHEYVLAHPTFTAAMRFVSDSGRCGLEVFNRIAWRKQHVHT